MNPLSYLTGADTSLYRIHEPEESREQTRRWLARRLGAAIRKAHNGTSILRAAILLPMAICITLGADTPGSQSGAGLARSGPPVPRDMITSSGCAVHNIPQMAAGYSLMLAGRFADAYSTFERGLVEVEKGKAPTPTRACLLSMMGFAELQQGHFATAVRWFERALALDLPAGALVACLTSNLATAYFEAGQTDMAEVTALRAARLSNEVFSSEGPEILFAQATLAAVHLRRGDGARAEPVLKRILSRAESTWGGTSYEASLAAGNLAMAYLVQRQYTKAQSLFERSLDALRRHPNRAVHEIATTEVSLALACAAGGRRREAAKWLERAMASAEQALNSDDPAFAIVVERSANALFLLKDYESGRQRYEQALTLLQRIYGLRSQPALEAFERYEWFLRDAKDKSRARDVADRRRELMR
jgi:tetratricopeptide (TPR) repeat protein